MIKTRDIILIVLLSFLWSFSFLIIRIGVETVNPLTFTFYRVLYAFLFLILLSICARANVFKYWRHTPKLILSSLLLNVLPFTFCAYGEVTIDSSTTGIIEGTTPFLVLFFGWTIFKQRSFSYRQARAFIMAFLGLLVVFYPFITEGAFHKFFGIGALLGMAVFFSLGFNYSEKYLKPIPPIEAITMQLFFAPLILLPVVLFLNGTVPAMPTSTHGLLAALGVTSSLGWVTFFYALRNTSAVNVSISTMITPIITILWGWLFLGEPITWNKILGTVIVLGALSILWNFHGQCIEKIKNNRNKKK